MNKSYICFYFLLLILVFPVFPEKLAQLDVIRQPSGFYVNQDQFYIVEFPNIFVYSLKDYSLLTKFGTKGEGPGEFLLYARLHFLPEYNIVQSQCKFSYYTKDWKFLYDRKVSIQFDRGAKFMGNQLVVSYTVPGVDEPKQTDLSVNIYSKDFNMIKEIYRQKYYFQIGKQINGIYLPETGRRSGIDFFVWDKKIYIVGEDGETGNLYIFNQQGDKINTLQLNFEKLKVTASHKKAVEDFYKLRHRRLLSIVSARGWLTWPEFFPSMHYVNVIDNSIYVIPYKKDQGKIQLFIFDLNGKLLKHMDAPIVEETIFSFYPFIINNSKLYQLLENENEIWELHANDVI